MITTSLVLCALTFGAQNSEYRQKYPFPDLTAPNGWGVNIHFTDPGSGEIERLAGAGFKWIRMDFVWSRIETAKGIYDFSAYDRLMGRLKTVGIRPLFILDYGNDLYQKGSPRSDEARAGFCRFVEASLRHFRRQGAIWEMWNEPNISFWQPTPNVDEYIALATAVGQTIRRTASDEWYIGPGVSTFDWAFLQKCIDSGLLKFWDAVSTHPYRGGEPESVIDDWRRLRQMIAAKSPPGKVIPMISSEWGYSDISEGIGVQRQGAFAVRQYLSNLTSGAPISILYDWKNDGNSKTDPESNFGAVSASLDPKPSYQKIQTINKALFGFVFKTRLAQDSDLDYACAFQRGKEVKFAVWTTSREVRKVQLHLGPDSQELALTEMPAILNSVNPALILSLMPLPRSIELSDAPQSLNRIGTLLQDQANWRSGDRHYTTIIGIKGSSNPIGPKVGPWIRAFESRLLSDWSARPSELQFTEISSDGKSLTREVECVQPKPVSIDLTMSWNVPWAVIHNPGKRKFTGRASWTGSNSQTISTFKSDGSAEQVVPLKVGQSPSESTSLLVSLAAPDGSKVAQSALSMAGEIPT
jgi:hypothetical protein